MQPQQFPKDNYNLIICKAGNQALRIQANDPADYENSRIGCAHPNPSDNGQIFIVLQIAIKNNRYEIVNCISDFVFDEQSSQVRLKRGKLKEDQLFYLEKASTEDIHQYYWIKTSEKGDKAVQLEGVLRLASFDENSQSQLFRFWKVNDNQTLQKSCIIMNEHSGKVIDVPYSSSKKGQRLIQWTKHKRWNQRWVLQKQEKGIIIKNVLNQLVLDISGQSQYTGAKVIQWQKTGGTNQEWIPEMLGNGRYKFRSCHQPSLFLAIKKESVQDGGQLEVSSKEENPSIVWILEGAQP